jgi:hypothetical protein
MTTRSIHDTVRVSQPGFIQTISSSNIAFAGIDTRAFDAALFAIVFGDIDEMGGSPVGAAQIDLHVEHAPDDGSGSPGSYSDVTAADIDGDDISVTSGIIASLTDDRTAYSFGYIGSNRFVRVTLEPTGLTNGGPVGLVLVQGHGHLTPVSQG